MVTALKAIWEGMQKVRAFAIALGLAVQYITVTGKLWVIGWADLTTYRFSKKSRSSVRKWH
jgi:hypothetical protein